MSNIDWYGGREGSGIPRSEQRNQQLKYFGRALFSLHHEVRLPCSLNSKYLIMKHNRYQEILEYQAGYMATHYHEVPGGIDVKGREMVRQNPTLYSETVFLVMSKLAACSKK